jgi:energy-coupling factor transport system permease protein
MDPRVRLLLVMAVGVLALSLERPLSLLGLAVVAGLPLLATRVVRRWWGRALGLVLLLIWSTAFSQGLFYSAEPRVPLLSLGPMVVWREGVLWGLVQSLRFIAVSLAGLGLALTTPVDRLMAGLRGLRVPFGLAFLAAMSLRFLPVLTAEWWTARRARARRGRPAWRRGPIAWLRLEVDLMRPVLARSLRRARSLAESLDARGFDATASRAQLRPLRIAGWEWPILIGAWALALGAAAGRALFLLYTTDTWYLPALRPLYAFFRGWL